MNAPNKVTTTKEILDRRTMSKGVYPSFQEVAKRIASEEHLVFYGGYDPTGPHIHIGHTVSLLLLKALARDLGHTAIVLFGDFTARIGDPTDKEAVRQALSEEEIEEHLKTWDSQVKTIFGDIPYEVRYNSEWLASMTFSDVVRLSAKVTVQQMLARDMFRERIKNERPIYLNEFLYPLAQGYDSVAMRVDGEVGGSEQTFNMLVGREFSKELLGKDKMVLTTPLIIDTKTGKKMSKSEGGLIAITDSPQEIRRKILDVEDGAVRTIFELCTEVPLGQIDTLEKEGPRAFKEALAAELVRMYHGEDAVSVAAMKLIIKKNGDLLKTLTSTGVVISAGELKRLIKEGAVDINGSLVDRWDIEPKPGDTIQIGKGKFYQVE